MVTPSVMEEDVERRETRTGFVALGLEKDASMRCSVPSVAQLLGQEGTRASV